MVLGTCTEKGGCNDWRQILHAGHQNAPIAAGQAQEAAQHSPPHFTILLSPLHSLHRRCCRADSIHSMVAVQATGCCDDCVLVMSEAQ